MSVHDIINEHILEKLEDGIVPWRMPWRGDAGVPRNLHTGYPYRGISAFLLAAAGFDSPFWLTFRQARQHGGTVRQGEQALPVVYWTWQIIAERDCRGEPVTRRVPRLRYCKVFNLAQCDRVGIPVTSLPPVFAFEPLARCAEIVKNMPDAPAIELGAAEAAYDPERDTVLLSAPHRFARPEACYAALFRQLVHATGHTRRLARPDVISAEAFAARAFAREGLVAEMGMALLCNHAGLPLPPLEDEDAYIEGWLAALRDGGPMLVQAASSAAKAADLILGRTRAHVIEPRRNEPAHAALA